MKKEILHLSAMGLALVLSIGLSSLMPARSRQLPARLSAEELSWTEFCRVRGYDSQSNDSAVINEYLDTWVGSIEEEIHCPEAVQA